MFPVNGQIVLYSPHRKDVIQTKAFLELLPKLCPFQVHV